jgi:HSP20 family protein
MANLERRQAGNQSSDFARSLDQVFSRFLGGPRSREQGRSGVIIAAPPIEAWIDKEDKEYHLSVAIPGVDPKAIQVNLDGNNVTVSGEHQSGGDRKKGEYLHRDFSQGRFERTIRLPEGVETDKLRAEYNNGVLEITAPIKESALPKRIRINSTEGGDGTSSSKREAKQAESNKRE